MIKFEIDNSKEGVEIFLDNEGVDELIIYLLFIKNKNESIHLTAGNELTEDVSRTKNKVIKHVKLVHVG